METKTCSFCGMEYPASEEKCPLCGHSEVLPDEEEYFSESVSEPSPAPEEKRPRHRTGARVAPSNSAIPKWLVVLTCVILALAVIIFVLFLLSRAGVFDVEKPEEGSVTLPLDPEDSSGETDADQTGSDTNQTDDTVPQTVLCTGLALNFESYAPTEAGETVQLVATVTPSDCTEEIFWSSSNPMVCSVADDGTVTILSAGDDVTISASCGSFAAMCIIETSTLEQTEQSDANASHAISAEDITFFSAGEQTTLRLSNTLAGDEIVWASEDSEVASVTQTGTVTAVSAGTANVTATLNGKTYTCIVRCNFINSSDADEDDAGTAESGRYTISHEDVTLHYLESESFRLSLTDYDGTIVWTSSDSSVCTVEGGIVTAVGSGSARVSALVGSTTYTCIVRCIE